MLIFTAEAQRQRRDSQRKDREKERWSEGENKRKEPFCPLALSLFLPISPSSLRSSARPLRLCGEIGVLLNRYPSNFDNAG